MYKRVCCLIFAVIFSLWASWHPLSSAGMEWYLKKEFQKRLGREFQADRIIWGDGTILFENPKLVSGKSAEASQQRFHAQQIAISYDYSLFHRKLFLNILFDSPSFVIDSEAETLLKAIVNNKAKKQKYFHLDWHLSIPRGTLEQKNQPLIPFSLEVTQDKTLHGNFLVQFDPFSTSKNTLNGLFISENSNYCILDLNFNQTPLSSISNQLNLFDTPLKKLIVTQGLLDGHATITLKKMDSPTFKGELIFTDLKANYPPFEFQSYISKAILKTPQNSLNANEPFGQFTLVDQCHLSLEKKYHLSNVTGNCYLNDGGEISINFKSDGIYDKEACSFIAQGKVTLAPSKTLFGWNFSPKEFQISCIAPSKELPSIQFFKRPNGNTSFQQTLDCKNFGNLEFKLLKLALNPYSEELQQMNWEQGKVDASFTLDTYKGKDEELKLTSLEAKNLRLNILPWDLSVHIPHLQGKLAANLNVENVLSTLQGSFEISQGDLSFAHVNKQKWVFQKINGSLQLNQGFLEKSVLTTTFADLDSKITLQSLLSEGILTLLFEGSPFHLSPFLSSDVSQLMGSHFHQEQLVIKTTLKAAPEKFIVDSTIHILNELKKNEHILHVGFDLERRNNSPFQSLNNLNLKNGWFKGENLPLELFVKPFVFSSSKFNLCGEADFEGTFDAEKLSTHYQAKSLILDHEDFRFEAFPWINEQHQLIDLAAEGQHTFYFNRPLSKLALLEKTRAFSTDLSGNFEDISRGEAEKSGDKDGKNDHFNEQEGFRKKSNEENDQGYMIVKHGNYLDKKSQLFFTDLKTTLEFAKEQIHAKQIEGYCCNLYLAGNIDVDYKNKIPDHFVVTITPNTLSGTAPNAQRLLSHFEPFHFNDSLPIQGNISLSKKPNYLILTFRPSDLIIQSRISGSLSDGALNCSSEDFSLQDLAFDFDYDHKAKTLLLENLQGTAFLGAPEEAEEYTLSGNYIHVSNFLKRQAKFDLSITNKGHEFLKLLGHTRQKFNVSKQEKLLFVFFDKSRSHINQMPFIRNELAFNQLLHVDHFHLEFNLDLQKMTNHLQSFSKTKIWHDIGLKKQRRALFEKSKGSFHVDLSYNQSNDQFFFGLRGTELEIGSHPINKCLLNGKKQGNIWSIEQLQIDNCSIAADLMKENQKWTFNFLGFRWGDSLLAGLKGEYLADQQSFNGNINLLEVDLQSLKKIPQLRPLINNYELYGKLKGIGTLQIAHSKESSHWEIQSLLNASIQTPRFLGISFEDVHHATFQFISGQKVMIKKVILPFKTAINKSFSHAEQREGFINIEKAEYDFVKKELNVDAAQFDLPSFRLLEIVTTMQRYFPSTADRSIEDLIIKSTRGRALQGHISVNINPHEQALRLELAKGKYWWLESEHDISRFVLEKDSKQIKAVLKYRLENQPFWIFVKSNPQLTQGKMFLSDELTDIHGPLKTTQSLAIDWTNPQLQGFTISKALGSFSGLNVDLVKHPQKISSIQTIPLIGKVSLDVSKAIHLLSPKVREKLIEWRIGKEYMFMGQWELKKMDQTRLGNFTFQGALLGQEIELNGFEFEFLQADISYHHDNIHLNNLLLKDPAGFLQIDHVQGLLGTNNLWHVAIGNCEIIGWQPSLLRAIDKQPLINNTNLIIPELKVSRIQGTLGDPNSFKGVGEISFDNRSRRVSHNPLFVIPTEIINRIGLDLSILTPVSGSILFKIEDGKIMLTKLKDVYNEGRISKFNLANSSHPSYMDFGGNLHLKIRMKNYNILFKLAELFTFSVTGSLQKPIYSINKQHKKGPSLKRSNH